VPDLAEGTGLDQELALRADFVPGAREKLPPHITGAAAADAPDGNVRDRAVLEVDKPEPARLDVELVEVGQRVALDVLRGDTRTLRVFIPELVPDGNPVSLTTFSYEGVSDGEAGVSWVNPNSGRVISYYFVVGEGKLVFVG
jgi:hypothetical protein